MDVMQKSQRAHTWRRAHVTAGLTGRDPNVKVKKGLTLICIYGDCNAILGFITLLNPIYTR